MLAYRNTSVDPCQDFFEYACGTYVSNHPVTETSPYIYIPAISGIQLTTDSLLAKMVSDPWPYLNEIYSACIEPEEVQMSEFWKTFSLYQTQVELFVYEWPQATQESVLGAWISQGIQSFANVAVYPLNSDPHINQVYVYPAGNTLNSYDPNSTEYVRLVGEITEFFTQYENPQQAVTDALLAIGVEASIASSVNPAPIQTMTINEAATATGFNFMALFEAMGANWTGDEVVNFISLDYFTNLTNIFSDPTAIQKFLEWKVGQAAIDNTVSWCWGPNGYTYENCQNIMSDAPDSLVWTQEAVCRYYVHNELTDYVGLILSYEIINGDVYDDIRNMTEGIQQAFGASLKNLTWLDPVSLANVTEKLSLVLQIIGHPNVLDKYTDLDVDNMRFYHNSFAISAVQTAYNLNQAFVPFNRSDFQFDPLIVNAFYDPITNTINFPAGILESPMFSARLPKLFQYSRLGYVVGHENTHGFDNQGSHYDGYGNYNDILDPTTRANFNNNAQCLATYYSQYLAYGDVYVNGTQTLPENIADIGGVKNSYRAYQNFVAVNGPEYDDYELIPELTTNQVFQLSQAQTWCAVSNQAYLEFQIQNDVHSPAKFRVLGPLSQFIEFANNWNCPAGSPMNPASRCSLW
eukprot:TRINITY_DN1545_c0_g1_i1.p1 TRINITY_DN1545_c0_g1~~TRINITY_DN1545_c0_g1_i1.p1  ORF type:complete len:670 (+),score=176.80 TRINITY_DN1545_c0_g1_i1:110-2011(+)